MAAQPTWSSPFVTSLLLAGAVGLVSTGCTTVPVSGRSQLNLVSDEQVTKLSIEQFEEIKARSRLNRDRATNQMVERVAFRIIDQVPWWEVPLAEWEVIVIDNPNQINAFAMAGGKIGVYTGLVNMVENEDQLAFVLAHEIAHVTSRHVHERLSQEMVRQAGGTALGAAALVGGGLTTYSIYSLYGMSSGVASLSFNREKEREADYIGLILMAKAGFDPSQAARVIELVEEKSSQAGNRAPASWASTHPSYGERILLLNRHQEEAMTHYDQSRAGNVNVGRMIGL